MALGCFQRNTDHAETFAPDFDFTTTRMILALATRNKAAFYQRDGTGAFLYSNQEQNVFMEQPKRFQEFGEHGHMWPLAKSIYGLKQAPRISF